MLEGLKQSLIDFFTCRECREEKESVEGFDQQQWLSDAEFVLRAFTEDKTLLSEKFMLLRRGLRHGSIFFPGENFPFVKLPDWYAQAILSGKLDQADKFRMKEVIEERQACFYVLNELIDAEKKLLTENRL